MKLLCFITIIVFLGCAKDTDCVRYDIEQDIEYVAQHNGEIWAASNAAICTIYVNKQPEVSGKAANIEIQKGDKFKVTKSQVNFSHTFHAWFDCEE